MFLPSSNCSCCFRFCMREHVSFDFFKSFCERLGAFILFVLVAVVFLEEEAGVYVCMSTRKGFTKTLHSLA